MFLHDSKDGGKLDCVPWYVAAEVIDFSAERITLSQSSNHLETKFKSQTKCLFVGVIVKVI